MLETRDAGVRASVGEGMCILSETTCPAACTPDVSHYFVGHRFKNNKD